MMKLSVIVPVFNEIKTIRSIIPLLFQAPCPIEREWIIVDDASQDGTREALQELSAQFDFVLLLQEKNQGKGAAVIRGIKAATGTLTMIQDADLEYDPHDVPGLLEPLLHDRADVVFGSRFKKNGFQVHRTYHYYVNYFLTTLSNIFSGIHLTDMETCYKIFRADLIQSMRLQSQRFGIEVELTAYVAKTRARIYELPIHYYPRTQLQGKKINWKDGFAALAHLLHFNLLRSSSDAFDKLPERYRS